VFDLEVGQDLGLAGLEGGHAMDGCCVVNADRVALDAAQLGQSGLVDRVAELKPGASTTGCTASWRVGWQITGM
jgi:hypothetical protein